MMTRTQRRFARRGLLTVAAATLLGLGAAGCGTAGNTTGMPGMGSGSMSSSASPSLTSMPGMDMNDMPTGDGLSATASGLTFTPSTKTLAVGKPAEFTFQIRGSDGKSVTTFADDQTKLMHFYLVRSDLTGFQHIHPTMAGDGTWTAPVQALQPGSYRTYASFIAKDKAGKQTTLVLSDKLTVAGAAASTPLPTAAGSAQVDGYTLALGSGGLMANMTHTLSVTISKGGKPVTDLQPYLDTYAHLTAFHDGDLAFAHLHPQGSVNGDHGGPTLTFEATLSKAGNWRLFLQFQTAGTLHTAAITLTAGG
jgi:hypothetical protein